jgi:hypothetical protein
MFVDIFRDFIFHQRAVQTTFGSGELCSAPCNSFVAHGSKIRITAVNQRPFAPPGASFFSAHVFYLFYWVHYDANRQLSTMIYDLIMHAHRETHPLELKSSENILLRPFREPHCSLLFMVLR